MSFPLDLGFFCPVLSDLGPLRDMGFVLMLCYRLYTKPFPSVKLLIFINTIEFN